MAIPLASLDLRSRITATLIVIVMITIAVGLAVWSTVNANGVTGSIVVNAYDDDETDNGNCSFREAVRSANTDTPTDACLAGNGSDNLILPEGRFLVSAREPVHVHGDLTITGAAPGKTFIEIDGPPGAGLGSIFSVTDAELIFSGLSFEFEESVQRSQQPWFVRLENPEVDAPGRTETANRPWIRPGYNPQPISKRCIRRNIHGEKPRTSNQVDVCSHCGSEEYLTGLKDRIRSPGGAEISEDGEEQLGPID